MTRQIVGIVLIVVGMLGLAFGGITYTREETVIDLGPVDARTETRERIPIPPVLGGVALIAGTVLLVLPRRQNPVMRSSQETSHTATTRDATMRIGSSAPEALEAITGQSGRGTL
jgi:hypothetical protein